MTAMIEKLRALQAKLQQSDTKTRMALETRFRIVR
jgi:hypothetical protein